MDLLPRTHHDFKSKDYWEKFFKKRGAAAFEWYGEYPRLCGILSKYIKTADNILMIGCGNSDLSSDLYDVGYHKITNIDISTTVINQMMQKNAGTRPDMQFLQMDLLKMSFADSQFSVVLDKGTLDALFTDDSPEVQKTIETMAVEIGRVLRVGGRYVCISLAQEHILNKIVNLFSEEGWMTRVCRVPDVDTDDLSSGESFCLPVFAFVFTKFKKMPNAKRIFEVAYFDDQVNRFESLDRLISAVREIQQYAMIRHNLRKGHTEEQLSVDLYSSTSDKPRYTIYIVDSTTRLKNKFAIFIVPQGRETEWLFATDDGRIQLQKTAGFERLLVVLLNREHTYASLEDVKAELSSKVLELSPPNVGKQSPFLSVGDDINLRTVRHSGRSELSGDYVVEDVACGEQTFRRLIFLSNRNLVQSEALLCRRNGLKKGKKKKQPMSCIDHNHLSSKYCGTIIAGLAFVEDLQRSIDAGLQIVLVGLGGGGLPVYLRTNIPNVHVDVVEIDPEIVTMATDWFDVIPDDRLVIHTMDGLEYIRNLITTLDGQKDVIILDVDSKDASVGMSCPPKSFVEVEFLKSVHRAVKPSGLLMLNLVCRSREEREIVITNLKSIFGSIFSVKVQDDVNETLYCTQNDRPDLNDPIADGKLPTALVSSLRLLQDAIQKQSTQQPKEILRVTQELERLTRL